MSEYFQWLKARFPEQKRKRGTTKTPAPLTFKDPLAIKAMDVRAKQLTNTLGYKINRTDVGEDAIVRDPVIKGIIRELHEQQELSEDRGDGPERQTGAAPGGPEHDRTLQQ